jgi:isopropylmalate/homocitrate/citramalate synthase
MSILGPALRLYDDTLRDGEQMAGLAFSPAQKLGLAQALAQAGVSVMQAGYPAASEGEAAACAVLLGARKRGGLPASLELALLARPTAEDLQACLEACRCVGVDPATVSVVVLAGVSDLHLRRKLGPRLMALRGLDGHRALDAPIETLRRWALDLALDGIHQAVALGFGLVECALEDASRADAAWVKVVAVAAEEAGARRITFCDTCGVLTPERVRQQLPALAAALGVGRGRAELACHFHDDYGLAAINTVQAALSGCTHLTVTLNGLGERCGNAALHRVAAPLRDLYGVTLPGFDYTRLRSLSALAERVSGELVPVHEAVVGRGAFRHESGLHVAALLEAPDTYQALDPASVGGHMELSFGKHSGRDGVAAALGPLADPRAVAQLTRRLKSQAERQAGGPGRQGAVLDLVEARDRLDAQRCLGADEVRALSGSGKLLKPAFHPSSSQT